VGLPRESLVAGHWMVDKISFTFLGTEFCWNESRVFELEGNWRVSFLIPLLFIGCRDCEELKIRIALWKWVSGECDLVRLNFQTQVNLLERKSAILVAGSCSCKSFYWCIM